MKVSGKWHYLSPSFVLRAIDREGNLVDSMLSEHPDMDSAKRFFKQAEEVAGCVPERVTTDGHDSYPRAIRRVLGRKLNHRTSRYLNNRLEQDHRGVKQRYYATIPCVVLVILIRLLASVARLTSSETISGAEPSRKRRSRWLNNARCSDSDLVSFNMLCNTC